MQNAMIYILSFCFLAIFNIANAAEQNDSLKLQKQDIETNIFSKGYACPRVDIFKNILSDIPFNAIFPISIGGGQLGSSKDDNRTPESASDKSICSCVDKFGMNNYGMVLGLWEIAYLIELVREPNCSMVLGIDFPFNNSNIGSIGEGSFDSSDLDFYHVHLYSFPLFTMLNLFTELKCGSDDYMDLDLLYASELDETWNDEIKSLLVTPELKFLADAKVINTCKLDAMLSFNENKTRDDLFYCAGSWGFLYPLSGYTSAFGSVAENTSLLATKLLALLHKRGLLKNTAGNDSLCCNDHYGEFKKSMYRFSLLYPIPETNDNHFIGSPVAFWEGDSRVPPGYENVIYVVWRYRNCCLGAYEK
jgi:conjugal transfer pilus assembly protein TraU